MRSRTTCAHRSPAPARAWRMPRCMPGRVPELRAAIERATADLDGIVAVFQALLRIAEIEAGSRRVSLRPGGSRAAARRCRGTVRRGR